MDTYAKRPLKPEEFYYAVVAGLDLECENLTEWNPQHTTTDDMKRFVSSSSKGSPRSQNRRLGLFSSSTSLCEIPLEGGGIRDLWPDLEKDFQSHSHNQLKGCCYAYMKQTYPNMFP